MTGLRLFYKTILFTLQAGDVAEGTHISVSYRFNSLHAPFWHIHVFLLSYCQRWVLKKDPLWTIDEGRRKNCRVF